MIQRVGVFDSGLGGLTVLEALLRSQPKLEYIYLGDTARTPYGSKSPSTIQNYARDALNFFLKHEVDLLVVACNTVSAIAINNLAKQAPFPVIGTIQPAVETCLAVSSNSSNGPIGIIGTAATIASNAYQNYLRTQLPGRQIEPVACPLFVPLVEEGLTSGPIVESVIAYYLSSLRNLSPQAVILGCTHYPLLLGSIKQFFGDGVTLVECSEAISRTVSKLAAAANQADTNQSEGTELNQSGAPVRYYVTDTVSRFNALAKKFLQDREIAAVKIESL